MGNKLSIKLHIANRIYPMKIERESEEYIRNAVKQIEGRLKFYEENYAIKDKQDLLAMCLIEYASKFESVYNKNVVEDDGFTEKSNPASVSIIFLLSEPDASTRSSLGIMIEGISTCLLLKFLRGINQIHKFCSCFRFISENAKHSTCDSA